MISQILTSLYNKYLYSNFRQHYIISRGKTYDDVLLKPKQSLRSRKDVILKTKLTRKIKINIPIISSNMDTVTGAEMAALLDELGGIGALFRLTNTIKETVDAIRKLKSLRPDIKNIAASIGVKRYKERLQKLVEEGVNIIVIDIANAYSKRVKKIIKYVRKQYPFLQIIAGNVATPEGVKFLLNCGVDAIKVGIGPGSLCTTRIVTGCGIPQLTAVYRCSKVAKKHGIPIIADGGIRTSGDAIKALAAGADTVMLGNLLSAYHESCGDVYQKRKDKFVRIKYKKISELLKKKNLYKIYRGMSSADVQKDAYKAGAEKKKDIAAEGEVIFRKLRGSAKPFLINFCAGIRSGMSYNNAKTISQLQRNAIFVEVTTPGLFENRAHAVGIRK